MFQIYIRVANIKFMSHTADVLAEDKFQQISFQFQWFQFVRMEVERWAKMFHVCNLIYFVIFSNIVIFIPIRGGFEEKKSGDTNQTSSHIIGAQPTI